MNNSMAKVSYADDTRTIATSIAQTLKPLGYKKRRNCFNRRLQNGLIHQLSIFSVGAYSIDHGKFYIHAGCYIPEVELYRKNVVEPAWVTDSLCTIRGSFPPHYLRIHEVAENLGLITSHLDMALEALAHFGSYEAIIESDEQGYLSEPTTSQRKSALHFDTPRPIVIACVQLTRSENEKASMALQTYLSALASVENPHRGHIEAVSEWATKLGLGRFGSSTH
jgi:hypothetical protein